MKIVRCFLNTDMRQQHDGLAKVALREKVDLQTLGNDEHVLFINTALNRIKFYASNGLLSYYRAKRKIDLNVIAELPKVFDENIEVSYTAALRRRLEKALSPE